MNMVTAVWAAVLLVMGLTVPSCREKSEAPGDGKEETGPQVEPQGGIKRVVAKSGWDIYVAGVYRYGPCIILNDDEHQLQIPLELLPDGADEGMAFTITIERNEEEEKRLAEEIATLKKSLSQ